MKRRAPTAHISYKFMRRVKKRKEKENILESARGDFQSGIYVVSIMRKATSL